MPEGTQLPEKYQQAEWIVRFTTDAVNHGRRDELADCFQNSPFSKTVVNNMGSMRMSYTAQSESSVFKYYSKVIS